MPRNHVKSSFFCEQKSMHDLISQAKLFCWYIEKHVYSKVYFYSCKNCGKGTSSGVSDAEFCDHECYVNFANKKKRKYATTEEYYKETTKTGLKFVTIQTTRYKSGKVIWNYLTLVTFKKSSHMHKKLPKQVIVYRGNDFFEACCFARSAVNKLELEKEDEIIPFSITKKQKARNYSSYLTRNKTGIVGVSIRKKNYGNSACLYYQARIYLNGKENELYFGDNFFDACCARKSAEIKQKANVRNKNNNKLGITGVSHVKRRNGKAWSSYSASIQRAGIQEFVYRGNDFFEACCRRKSAELVSGRDLRVHV